MADDSGAASGDSARWVVEFVERVRREGVPVPVGATIEFARALGLLGTGRGANWYWAGRATLVPHPEDIAAYDRAFAAFAVASDSSPADPPNLPFPAPADGTELTVVEGSQPGSNEPAGAPDRLRLSWSATEVLRQKDLGQCSADELAEAHRMIAAMRVRVALRRSRRHRPARRHRGAIDVRRTVRRSLRTGGEVARLAHSERATRPRQLVLLLDVSGSMEPYARSLARFAHAVVAARRWGDVEVFAVGTRVTRVTRELSSRDPDRALSDAAAAVADWSGGTRLGEGLATFNARWGVRGVARGAIVVILSDGWERGDPNLLARELARLRRVAHRLVWVNPLKASPGFAPRAQGMAAALPHVDEFVEGHSVASLEALAEVVGR